MNESAHIAYFCYIIRNHYFDEIKDLGRGWDSIASPTKLLFIDLANYCISQNKGNIIIAKRIMALRKRRERYKVIRKIAQGGYGETYLVKSILTDKEYVCKIQEDGKEARREVTTLLALRDLSCVVSIENAWVKDGYCYIILEKLGPCRESVDTIRSSVKKCLGKIHERGLVHGDLNHQNVLCDGKNPVLIDFGEAKDKRAVSSQEFDDLMQEDLDRLTGKYFTFTGQELDENFQTYWPDFKADLDKPNGRDSLMPVK